MKKHKICKILLVILAIFLCVAFYELLGICVAYKKQPEVSNTTKKETKNGSWNECSENTERAVIIEKNPEALLQSAFDQECKKGNYSFYFCISIR